MTDGVTFILFQLSGSLLTEWSESNMNEQNINNKQTILITL